jgi:hypothetical protein
MKKKRPAKGNVPSVHEFNPVSLGFKKEKRGYRDIVYTLYGSDKKIIGWLAYYEFLSPPQWLVYKETYFSDGMGGDHSAALVYQGKIPSNAFGKQLLKNLSIK